MKPADISGTKVGTSVRQNYLASNNQCEQEHLRYVYENKMNLRGYQSRSNLVEDENGDLLAVSYNILNM
jgi:hypothetical protein